MYSLASGRGNGEPSQNLEGGQSMRSEYSSALAPTASKGTESLSNRRFLHNSLLWFLETISSFISLGLI